MHAVYLLTGSNMGDRAQQLSEAIRLLNIHAGSVVQQSSVYQTEAWGKEGLPAHLNQALLLNTSLEPSALLKVIHEIEASLGRIRTEKWGVRMIDIDIIFFGDTIINQPDLIIPHPLMQERNFVLLPLCELAPDFIHPLFKKPLKVLLQQSSDTLKAEKVVFV